MRNYELGSVEVVSNEEMVVQQTFINQWRTVDQTGKAAEYQNYLHQVSGLEAIHFYKQQSLALLRVQPGDHLLDIGCGNGDEVRALAQMVGDSGLVIGIDSSVKLIEGAQQSEQNAGLPVRFEVGDAHNLPYENECFAGCRADRVLQHVTNREVVLSEMSRVTRAGGWLVVNDPDWETLVVDAPSNRGLTRKILNYVADHAATTGWAGRETYRLFKQAELQAVTVTSMGIILTDFGLAGPLMHLQSSVEAMVRQGELTSAEATGWLDDLRAADQRGQFFSAVGGFTVAGQKP
jgi:ubiquinone/menaquinone biosynthesis C-methylase UbiE